MKQQAAGPPAVAFGNQLGDVDYVGRGGNALI